VRYPRRSASDEPEAAVDNKFNSTVTEFCFLTAVDLGDLEWLLDGGAWKLTSTLSRYGVS
jgi:hypothetical protein